VDLQSVKDMSDWVSACRALEVEGTKDYGRGQMTTGGDKGLRER